MRRSVGDKATPIRLPAIDDQQIDTGSLHGRPYLLSFFRFATCPFCNLRVRSLVQQYDTFGSDFTIVALFDAPFDHLQRHAARHQAPFPILADPGNIYYRTYGIEHRVVGMLKGIFFRMPTLLKGMAQGYLPFLPKGSLITMPAEFLIDREGVIQVAYYGQDEGDHLDLETIRTFSLR